MKPGDGDRRYEVRRFRFGAAIFGFAALEDVVALAKAWARDEGWDTADSELAVELGASLVVGSETSLDAWRKVLEVQGRKLQTEQTASSPPVRYHVTRELVDAVEAGRWNSAMVDALAKWAKGKLQAESYRDRWRAERFSTMADRLENLATFASAEELAEDRHALKIAAELLRER